MGAGSAAFDLRSVLGCFSSSVDSDSSPVPKEFAGSSGCTEGPLLRVEGCSQLGSSSSSAGFDFAALEALARLDMLFEGWDSFALATSGEVFG